jgi:hypothetical protein
MPSTFDLIQAAGAIATVLGVPLAIFFFLRARGRLKIRAGWTDEKGASGLLASTPNSLTVQATNHGQEVVIISGIIFGMREKFFRSKYVILELAPNLEGTVKLGPGEQFSYIIPFAGVHDGGTILSDLGVRTTLGKTYGVGWARFLQLRLEAYVTNFRHRRKPVMAVPAAGPVPEIPAPIEPLKTAAKRKRTSAKPKPDTLNP